MDRTPAASRRTGLRRWLPWPVRTLGQLLVIGLVIEFVLLPQLAGVRGSLRTLLDIDSVWVVSALACELASFATFAAATRAMLPAAHRPPYLRVLRIDLATIGLNHAVPGGSAAGTALGMRLLAQEDVPAGDAAFAKVAQGVGASLLLVVLLWTAVAIAIPLHGSSPLYLASSAVGLAAVVLTTTTIVVFRHGRGLATSVFCRITRLLPFVADDAGERVAHMIGSHIDLAFSEPRRLLTSMSWAAANWLLDAAALWCCLRGYGHSYGYDGLMTSYALAQVAAWIPLTPGGLGIVEGVLVPTLLGFGGTRGTVVLGVITYRLMSYWLTIPLGTAAYGGIAGGRWWRRSRDRG